MRTLDYTRAIVIPNSCAEGGLDSEAVS